MATVLGGLLTAMLAGPASADTAGYRDPAGDLMVAKFSGETFEPHYQPSSSPNGDVIAASFHHGKRAISLYMRYREIYVPKLASTWTFLLQGSNHQRRAVQLTATSQTVGGRAHMFNPRNGRTGCKVASKINYRTNSVLVKFPSRCLKHPESIRLSSVNYTFAFTESEFYVYYDDPTRTGGTIEDAGSTPTRWIKAS